MSHIFASEHARSGVPPIAQQRADNLVPRASVSPIGVDLQDDDTISFQRLADGDYDAEPCYLPWCAADICAIDNYPDPAHEHTSAVKRIDTGAPSSGSGDDLIETNVIRLSIEQSDNDEDSEYTTGEAHAYLAIGETGKTDAYVYLTAEKLLELGNTAITQAQVMFASRGLANPNRVTVEEVRIAGEKFDRRIAERDAEEAAEKAEKDAARKAELDGRKVPRWQSAVFKAGRALGSSWLGVRFPRFMKAVSGTHEPKIVHWFRLGVDMGLIRIRLGHTK